MDEGGCQGEYVCIQNKADRNLGGTVTGLFLINVIILMALFLE